MPLLGRRKKQPAAAQAAQSVAPSVADSSVATSFDSEDDDDDRRPMPSHQYQRHRASLTLGGDREGGGGGAGRAKYFASGLPTSGRSSSLSPVQFRGMSMAANHGPVPQGGYYPPRHYYTPHHPLSIAEDYARGQFWEMPMAAHHGPVPQGQRGYYPPNPQQYPLALPNVQSHYPPPPNVQSQSVLPAHYGGYPPPPPPEYHPHRQSAPPQYFQGQGHHPHIYHESPPPPPQHSNSASASAFAFSTPPKSNKSNKSPSRAGKGWGNVRRNPSSDTLSEDFRNPSLAETSVECSDADADEVSDLSTESAVVREAAEAAREAKKFLDEQNAKHREEEEGKSSRRGRGGTEHSVEKMAGRSEISKSSRRGSGEGKIQKDEAPQKREQQQLKKTSDHFRSVGYISLLTFADGSASGLSAGGSASVLTGGCSNESSKGSSSRGTADTNSSRHRLMETIRCSQMDRLPGSDDATASASTVRTSGTLGTRGTMGTALARTNSAAVKRVAPIGTVMSLDACEDDDDEGGSLPFGFGQGPVDVDDGVFTGHADVDSIVRRYAGLPLPSSVKQPWMSSGLTSSSGTGTGTAPEDFASAVREAHSQARKLRAEGEYLPAIEAYSAVLASHVGAYTQAELPQVASALHHLGVLHICAGLQDDAHTLISEALTMRKDCLGREHLDTASTLSELGVVRYARGEFDGALSAWWEALRIITSRSSPHPATGQSGGTPELPNSHPHVIRILNNMGCAHYESCRYKSALATFQQAANLRRSTLGSVKGVGAAGALLDVSTTLCNAAASVLARCAEHNHRGEASEGGEDVSKEKAAALLEEGLMLQRSVLGDDHRKVRGTETALEAAQGRCGSDQQGRERTTTPMVAEFAGLVPVNGDGGARVGGGEGDGGDDDSAVESVRSGVCVLTEL